MQSNRILLAAWLATTAVMADDQPDIELLEFLGGDEIEVNGEWINPMSLELEEDGADMAQVPTQTPRGESHE